MATEGEEERKVKRGDWVYEQKGSKLVHMKVERFGISGSKNEDPNYVRCTIHRNGGRGTNRGRCNLRVECLHWDDMLKGWLHRPKGG